MRNLKILFLFLITTIFSCSDCNYKGQYLKSHIKYDDQVQPPKPRPTNIDCIEAQEEAKKDHKNKKLKYYIFSIATVSFELTGKIKKKYNVEIISLACVADTYLVCYNEFVDNILVNSIGKDLLELYEREDRMIGK